MVDFCGMNDSADVHHLTPNSSSKRDITEKSVPRLGCPNNTRFSPDVFIIVVSKSSVLGSRLSRSSRALGESPT